MKKLVYLLPIVLAALGSLASCREKIDDLLNDRLKNQYTDYLHNETNQDVTVYFRPRDRQTSENTFRVRKGETVEIPDSIRLGTVAVRHLQSDSVVFVFADGTRVVHSYTNTTYGQDSYHFVYKPEKNNIYYTGYDIPTAEDSWVLRILGTRKFRVDYYIR